MDRGEKKWAEDVFFLVEQREETHEWDVRRPLTYMFRLTSLAFPISRSQTNTTLFSSFQTVGIHKYGLLEPYPLPLF